VGVVLHSHTLSSSRSSPHSLTHAQMCLHTWCDAGETPEQISARKLSAWWGRFLPGNTCGAGGEEEEPAPGAAAEKKERKPRAAGKKRGAGAAAEAGAEEEAGSSGAAGVEGLGAPAKGKGAAAPKGKVRDAGTRWGGL
jgi:hypothetical protein